MSALTMSQLPSPEGADGADAQPRYGWLRRTFMRYPWHLGTAAGVVFLTLFRVAECGVFEPHPPAITGQLDGFSLALAGGGTLTSDDLAGEVWVASFTYSRCQTTRCEAQLQGLEALSARWAKAGVPIRLVTFSVDPEHDTPARLAEWARERGVTWPVLTASSDAGMRAVVVGGFRATMGDPVPTSNGVIEISHSRRVAIVDGEGRVRGFYDTDERGLDEVFWRSQHVLEQMREEGGR